jgi:LacI family gluconate utilization system Gnt-I transcriptional repressor
MPRKRSGNNKVTLKQVAESAGVSAITVSRALRQPELVAEEARQRVLATVKQLNYMPDPAASALASTRTNVIGVLIPSVTNNVFSAVLSGIYDGVEGSRFHLQLANTRYRVGEEEKLLRIFRSQKPAGLIVSGIDQSATSREILDEMNCPIVQIMETGPYPIDMMVGFSHRDGARAGTRHLVAAGYRRIAFMGARMDPRTQRRFEGYRAALEEAGLYDERLVSTTLTASSVMLGGEMLSDLWAAAPDADAVFCNNDDIALGALFECQRRKVRVPADFGIVGFNDLEMMAAASPALTSVRTHRYEMGSRAIGMLIDAIAGRRPEQPVIDLGFEVMARESTRREVVPA